MQFFKVHNFEKFQHYSDRRPPWIKLYRDLWDDPRFFDLGEADRYLLIGIFVLASQHDNKVSANQKWLKAQLLTSRAIPLQKLVDTGWIEPLEQDASKTLGGQRAAIVPLAACEPSRARGETETEVQNTDSYMPAEDAHASAPLQLGEFQWVHVTAEQHAKLQSKLNGQLDSYIARFDRWVNEAPDAKVHGVRRRDRHAYESILNWFDRDGAKPNGNQHKSKTDRNAEAAQRLLSRLDSQDSGGSIGGNIRSDPGGLFGASPPVKRK